MGDKNNDQSIMDKSMRSVFVGNIPYEATEEKLKDIFSEVGPVLSLKLVFDRESGKPKGYGFCEYKDQETALSAMRNLNGYEIGGRTLRVDNACTEKSRMEMAALLSGPQIENPYGEHCEPDQAPEIITKAVTSLPPEQMYELMRQMKTLIQNDPHEARQMLIQNPQLAYALLQAQVVMRIVDPVTAVSFLFKPNSMPPVLTSQSTPQNVQSMLNVAPSIVPPMPVGNAFNQDTDLRSVDPRLNRAVVPPTTGMDMDLRMNTGGMDMAYQRNVQPAPVKPSFQTDPRQQRSQDPRQQKSNTSAPPAQFPRATNPTTNPGIIPSDASDNEKTALIMQVLKLTDEQIAVLPMEQRASILALKEQIAKSAKTSSF